MHEPPDSRPQQTANRLRLLTILPVLIATASVVLLLLKLVKPFGWFLEETATSPALASTKASFRLPAKSAPAHATNQPAPDSATIPPLPPSGVARSVAAAVLAQAAQPFVPADVGSANPVQVPAGSGSGGVGNFQPGGIMGVVLLRGTPPAEKEIPMDPGCGALHPQRKPTTRFFVVGTNGGLADVVVTVDANTLPGPSAVPAMPVEIRQRNCEFVPYVSAAHVRQIVRVFNDDPVMHNVHPTPTVDSGREINRAQLPKGPPLDHTFPKPESFLRFKCDVHPWMFAYVTIVEHPFFAVTDGTGRFAIPEPPPGNHTVRFHHRRAGTKSVAVQVSPGKRLTLQITLDLADPSQSEATVTEE